MQCDVTRCAICIPNNVEYFNKEESKLRKCYQRNYAVNLNDIWNVIKKMLDKIRVTGILKFDKTTLPFRNSFEFLGKKRAT